jgi:hypothetical protein
MTPSPSRAIQQKNKELFAHFLPCFNTGNLGKYRQPIVSDRVKRRAI